MKFEGDHYITSALKLGDWNLIYDLNDSLFNSNRIYFEIIFANFLLFSSIIIIFNLLSNNIKLEAQKREMLLKEANYDELTGLYNKKKFFEHARVIFENAERGNIDFALAMIDLDDFKLVNDQYGHMAGDHILKKTAQLIKNNIRKTDLAARFGGEEFCLVLAGVNKKAAYQKIEEIRKKIAEHNFIYQEEIINVTVSAGISLEIKDSIKSMIIKADKLLYKSKKEGKNRTTID